MQSIEYQILLAACDVKPNETQRVKRRVLMAREFDPERLVELSIQEGLTCLLFKSLKKAGVLGYLGHQHIQRLQSCYYFAAHRNLKLIQDLKKILHQLNQNKTPVVLLQGMPLLQQIYTDIGLRPMTDIDLWVLPENFDAVEKGLTKLGYCNDSIYPKTFRRDSTIIDLNTHILWADRIKSRRFLVSGRQEDIYDNCQVMDFDGEQTRCLGRYDQVLYLSLHAFKHCANRLIWFADIKILIADWKAADWKALFDRARQLGQENAIIYMLFLIGHLFDDKLPCDIQTMAENHRLTYLESAILRKRLSGQPMPGWAPMVLFTTGKALHKRLYFIFENMFPRPQILRQIFGQTPDLKTWQLYLKRALQLVGMVKSNRSV
jgi:hypothetical protein